MHPRIGAAALQQHVVAAGGPRLRQRGFHHGAAVTQPATLTARDATALSTGGAAVLSASDQAVIDNMRTRINELESKLNSSTNGLGLLAGTA